MRKVKLGKRRSEEEGDLIMMAADSKAV